MVRVWVDEQTRQKARSDIFDQAVQPLLEQARAQHFDQVIGNLLPDLLQQFRANNPFDTTEYQSAQSAQFSPSAAAPAQSVSQLPPPAAMPNAAVSAPAPAPAPAGAGGDYTQAIMDSAQRYGIDPQVALRVAQSEGGTGAGASGDQASSFGPFQLHYGGVAQGGNAVAGLGDEFTRQTGLDARDPANTQAAIDFALKNAAQSGWGAFHGAARAGIGEREGILGSGGAPAGAGAGPLPRDQSPGPAARTSQFGMGLSADDAYAFCGPAAAIAFANTYGRFPTVDEAKKLAAQYGWNQSQGMAGIASEQKMLSEGLGIPTKLEAQVDWQHVAQDAQSGNPVIISTPRHYFYVSGYDPQTQTFNVGTSGTDLKGGSRQMTADQIAQFGGGVQGALYADNPQSPVESIAKAVGGAAQSFASQVQSPNTGNPVVDALGTAASGLGTALHTGQEAIRSVTPSSQMAREAAGMEQLGRENKPLIDEQTRLLRAVDSGGLTPEEADRAWSRLQQIDTQLNQAYGSHAQNTPEGFQQRMYTAAERNPDLPTLETGANLAFSAVAAPMAGAGAPLAAKAAAAAIDPMTGLPAVAGRAVEAAAPVLRSSQRGEAEAGFAAGGLGKILPKAAATGDVVADKANAAIARKLGVAPTEVRPPAVPERLTEAAPQGFEQAEALPGADVLQGLINMAKARGKDTSELERQLSFQQKMAQVLRNKQSAQLNLGVLQNPQGGPQWLGQQVANQPPLPGMPAPKGSIADKAIALRYAEMLGNWYTQVANIASNTGQAFVQPLRLAASGHPGEGGAFIRGMAEGIPHAIANFANTLNTGVVNTPKAQFQIGGAWGRGTAGRIIDAPTNFMAAADQFFQTVAMGGFIRAEAVRQAGGNAQLAAQLTAHPSPTMLKAAQDFAQRAVYSEDPGRIINWLSNRAGLSGGERLAVSLLVPFLKVPANITRRGVSFAAKPVTGTIGAVGKLKAGDTRGASLDAADAALSAVVMLGLAGKAASGELSGEGPTDPGKRQLLTSQGWQPHSIRIGNTWYDYSWAGPLAIPAGFVANTFEAMQERKADKPGEQQIADMAGRMGKALLRQTFLQNIGSLFDDKTGGAVSVLQNLVASTVVPNVVKDVEGAIDPYERKPEGGIFSGTLGRIQERVPGLANLVPAQQDVLGRPLASRRGGPKLLRESQVHSDSVINAFGQAGLDISAPRDQVSLKMGNDSVSIHVTPEEQRQWNADRGEFVDRVASGIVDSPGFQQAPIAVRQRVLRQVMDAASQYATAKLASHAPDLNQRIAAGVQEKLSPNVRTLPPQ